MSEYFTKPKFLGRNVKLALGLSNYATKSDATEADTLDFAKKSALANLKSDVDKLDIDKLKNVPSGFFGNLKSKVDKLGIEKIETTPVDLTK